MVKKILSKLNDYITSLLSTPYSVAPNMNAKISKS